MDPKKGLGPSSANDSMSRWKLPQPGINQSDAFKGKSPAGGGGGAAANKHATTPSSLHGVPASIKSRY